MKEMRSNVKTELKEMSCEDKKWMELAQSYVHLEILTLSELNFGFCCQNVKYSPCMMVFQCDLLYVNKEVVLVRN
jgi:hypothetical protein